MDPRSVSRNRSVADGGGGSGSLVSVFGPAVGSRPRSSPAPMASSSRTFPAVSVIVPSYNAAATIERCLGALESQTAALEGEVIVVDSSSDGTAEIVARRFPWVRLIACPTRRFPGDARNLGIGRARADLLAFTDADCIAERHWLETIIMAHRVRRDPLIGGAIENGNPESRVGWAAYLLELSQWMP